MEKENVFKKLQNVRVKLVEKGIKKRLPYSHRGAQLGCLQKKQ